MLARLIAFGVGVFWGCLYSMKSLFDLVWLGPKKYFFINRNISAPEELYNVKYGEHKIINLGPVKLHYVISGPENAPLMLLLHGFPEVWYSWRHQILEFQKNFRVVAVDMRGFGDSDKPKGLKHYTLDVLVEDMKLLIEGLGYKSCVLVAHDWGGAVGWALANKHPQMVARLVVLNMCPAPLWWKGATSNFKQFLCSGYIYFFFLPFLPEFIMGRNDLNIFKRMFNDKFIGLKSGPLNDTEIECFRHYFRQKGSLTSGINFYRANLWPPGPEHSFKYPMPVHIIWGMKDPFLTQILLNNTLSAVPHASVTRIDDSSHWVQNDRPLKVAKAIQDFLKFSNFDMNESDLKINNS